jgi:hypothetical protein
MEPKGEPKVYEPGEILGIFLNRGIEGLKEEGLIVVSYLGGEISVTYRNTTWIISTGIRYG